MVSPGCPDPAGCPVVGFDRVRDAPLFTGSPGRQWVRCYDGTWGYDEADPGYGDTRFAPIADDAGRPVPTMYLAENEAGALLETVFHDVGNTAAEAPVGEVYEATLSNWLLAHLSVPVPLTLVDLRDPALTSLGVDRSSIVSTYSEHYPCTRALAAQFYQLHADVDGLIWHSRQTEFHQAAGRDVPDSEVAVVFANRVGLGRGGWHRPKPGILSLGSGAGRTLVDIIADKLGVDVITC